MDGRNELNNEFANEYVSPKAVEHESGGRIKRNYIRVRMRKAYERGDPGVMKIEGRYFAHREWVKQELERDPMLPKGRPRQRSTPAFKRPRGRPKKDTI